MEGSKRSVYLLCHLVSLAIHFCTARESCVQVFQAFLKKCCNVGVLKWLLWEYAHHGKLANGTYKGHLTIPQDCDAYSSIVNLTFHRSQVSCHFLTWIFSIPMVIQINQSWPNLSLPHYEPWPELMAPFLLVLWQQLLHNASFPKDIYFRTIFSTPLHCKMIFCSAKTFNTS